MFVYNWIEHVFSFGHVHLFFRSYGSIESYLKDFFEELIDETEVPATGLVGELKGIGLRAGEEEKI